MSLSNSPLTIVAAFGLSLLLLRVFRRKTVIDNLPGPPSASFWTGDLLRFYDSQSWDFRRDLAQNYGPVARFSGFFGRPILYVSDPKAMRSILVKEHDVYEESEMFLRINYLIFGPALASTLGEMHRKQRQLLNPAFSTSRMRNLLPLFYDVTHKLRQAVSAEVHEGVKHIDMCKWLGRTALELIGRGGLGYSFDPLVSASDDALGEAVKGLVPSVLGTIPLQLLGYRFSKVGPPEWRRRVVDMFPSTALQTLKRSIDVMHSRSIDIFNEKKESFKAGEETTLQQMREGSDIMSILMKANLEASTSDRLPEAELVAQMALFIIAGMDTTSNTLCRIFHLIAMHSEVQEKLRQEIIKASHGQNVSYDELMSLPYLEAVIRETLRVYPVVEGISRVPQKDMILPLSAPIRGRDGAMIQEIPIPRNTEIMLGISGSNCSKSLWGEDAEEWKPDRWLCPLPIAVTEARVPGVYSNLMTFLGGTRSCIGFKFAELEMKVLLFSMLSSFRFNLPDSSDAIVWNVASVSFPSMGSTNSTSSMLLNVTLLEGTDSKLR